MATVGKAVLELTTDSSAFHADLNAAQARLAWLDKQFQRAAASLSMMGDTVRLGGRDLSVLATSARLAGTAAHQMGGDAAAAAGAMESAVITVRSLDLAIKSARLSMLGLIAVVPLLVVGAFKLGEQIEQARLRADALGRALRWIWILSGGTDPLEEQRKAMLGLRAAQEFIATPQYQHRLREQGLTLEDLAEGYRRGRTAVERMTEAEQRAREASARRAKQLAEEARRLAEKAAAERLAVQMLEDELATESRMNEILQVLVPRVQALAESLRGLALDAREGARAMRELQEMALAQLIADLGLTEEQAAAVRSVFQDLGIDAARELARTLLETAARVAEVNRELGQAGSSVEDFYQRQQRGADVAGVVNEALKQEAERLEEVRKALEAGADAWADWAREQLQGLEGMDPEARRAAIAALIDEIKGLGPSAAAALEVLSRAWLKAGADVEDVAEQMRKDIKNLLLDSFTRFFEDVLSQAQSFGDALRGFFQSLISAIASMLARLAATRLLNWIGVVLGIPWLKFAEGGVLKGMVAAQHGLVATGPMMASLAEQPGMTEVVMPLPAGLKPQDLAEVINRGGQGPEVNVQLVQVFDPKQIPPPPPGYVQQIFVMDVNQRGPIFRALKLATAR